MNSYTLDIRLGTTAIDSIMPLTKDAHILILGICDYSTL